MIIRCIWAELMKLRRSPLWLAFFLLPVIPAVMGTFNYLQNTAILTDGWYSLWTQHTLFFCYFFQPALIGVCCAYLFRLEYRNHNWNALRCAPVPPWCLVVSKLAVVAFMAALCQIFAGLLFVLSGLVAGLRAPLPPELPIWLARGWCGCVAVASVQLLLSLVIRSFAVPVGLSLAGGIAGLAASAKGFGPFVPYALPSLGMAANNAAARMPVETILFLGSCAVFTTACGLAAAFLIARRDVRTS